MQFITTENIAIVGLMVIAGIALFAVEGGKDIALPICTAIAGYLTKGAS
jgi:hypothetical protein